MIKSLRPSDIKYLVVHCSDSPPGRGDNAKTIHQWHTERGFDCIGYHKVILEDGTIESGRPEYLRGAHCRGLNYCSLSVCLIGQRDFSEAQICSLEEIIREWENRYPNASAVEHHSLDESKTCPNFELKSYFGEV